MKAILKTKELTFGEVVINIRELSALQYLDQQEYMAAQSVPADVSEGMTQEELNAISRAWNRVSLNGWSRLIAYSLCTPSDDIDEFQLQVQNSYTLEFMKVLHDEIAVLSGFILGSPDDLEEESKADSEADSEAETSPK